MILSILLLQQKLSNVVIIYYSIWLNWKINCEMKNNDLLKKRNGYFDLYNVHVIHVNVIAWGKWCVFL